MSNKKLFSVVLKRSFDEVVSGLVEGQVLSVIKNSKMYYTCIWMSKENKRITLTVPKDYCKIL
jgi:hypothetical protein